MHALEDLLTWRKKPVETMTQYFHDKAALVEYCELTGDKATSLSRAYRRMQGPLGVGPRMSCMRGSCPSWTDTRLVNRCRGLLVTDGRLKVLQPHRRDGGVKAVVHERRPATEGAETARKLTAVGSGAMRCYNCQEMETHLSRHCTKPRVNRSWKCAGSCHVVRDCQ